jgi:catechol 2,3-dioxygenase-like lactoylglutathione lyase family enzyme
MTALHHIGYYVDDLEEAVHRAIRDLGIGPFLRHEHITFDEFACADGIAGADAVTFDHSAAFAAWGPLVLELAQVHDIDDGLAAAYGVAPGAMSHVSWIVDDLAAERDRLVGLGCAPINTARTGPIHVSWHSGGPLFPHPIEVHESNFAIDGMHARLAGLAADWDGVTDPIRPMRPPVGQQA